MASEILVIPHPHPGHCFPATELALNLAARNNRVTLFLPSASSSISLHPLIQTVEISLPDPLHFPFGLLEELILPILADRVRRSRPVCAVVDEMMGWLIDACHGLQIPAVSFFTSSACSAAVEYAKSKVPQEELNSDSGRILSFPGLPDDMELTASDLQHHAPGHRRGPLGGGPKPKRLPDPRGLAGTGRAIALLINTCNEIEREFLDYVEREAGKQVWAVGPLLPARLWSRASSAGVGDAEVRGKRESSVSEKEVIEWLDSEPRGSVVYVSFGSLVGPSDEELVELAAGLDESTRFFIWVVQAGMGRTGREGAENGVAGFSADELARRTLGRGLIIKGWAPQLSILSHVATGGYVCHCGWNSTLEAIGFGVPVLTWPVRGDQLLNAKLLTSRLKVGLPVRSTAEGGVTRDDVRGGIEKLMADAEIKKRAASLKSVFAGGFPKSSSVSVDAFLEFVNSKGDISDASC